MYQNKHCAKPQKHCAKPQIYCANPQIYCATWGFYCATLFRHLILKSVVSILSFELI